MELFLECFEFMGKDLLAVVEDSMIFLWFCLWSPKFHIHCSNPPKYSDVEDFNDYSPISLCKFVYKLIAKVIAIHLKETLSRCMTLNKFGFLHDR